MSKYQIIYADPPWRYEFSPKARGAIERHYPTMTIEEICELNMGSIADKDCYLFLWTTMPKLPESLEVVKAWGFNYRTIAFVWVKTSKQFPSKPRYLGSGSYTRPNAELVILARNSKSPIKSTMPEQVIMAPRSRHSQKPVEVKQRIVSMLGDLPRIELFSRTKNSLFSDGWDVWGDEVENSIEFAPNTNSKEED